MTTQIAVKTALNSRATPRRKSCFSLFDTSGRIIMAATLKCHQFGRQQTMRIGWMAWMWIAAFWSFSAAAFGATAADVRIADAAKNSNWVAVRSLLQEHADVNGIQADGST